MKKGVAGLALAAALLWAAEGLAEDAGGMDAGGMDGNVARAASVRMLQSELMVAALGCHGDLRATLVADYNHFVRQFSPDLIHSANTLRGHFRETYGATHRVRFDSFLTHLANLASLNSIREATYCEDRARLAKAALDLKETDLASFTIATYTKSLAELSDDVPAPRDRRLAARLAAREKAHNAFNASK